MASIYCEVCGTEIKNIRDPKRLIAWNHNEAKSLVGCIKHNRYALYEKKYRRYDPLTGKKKEGITNA